MIVHDVREEAISQLKKLARDDGDIEAMHSYADDILCKVLFHLGYGDVVEAWKSVPKWYA